MTTDRTTHRVKVDIDTASDRFAVWKDGLGWVDCDLRPAFATHDCGDHYIEGYKQGQAGATHGVREGVERMGWRGLPAYAIAYAAAQRDFLALLDEIEKAASDDH